MSGARKMVRAEKYPRSSAISQRKTLLSNWKTRNDSSEVNAILQPELDLVAPRRFIHEPRDKSPEKGNKGVYRKCCLGTNTCYCREKSIKPRIISKPGKCLALEDIERRIGVDDLARTSLQCFCKVDSTKIPTSEMIKKYKEEIESKNTSLQLTDQREDYEVYREDQEDKYLRELAEHELEEEESLEVDGNYYNDNYDNDAEQLKEPYRTPNDEHTVSTVLGTRAANSLIGSSGFITEGLDLDDIRKFRDDHYFETHNVDDVHQNRDIPDHTCIHQFKLDERFLPSALNVDVYGRSRCLICSKPMEEDRVQLSKSNLSIFSGKTTNQSMRNLSKCYELGLFPRVINIGGEKSKVALKLSDNHMKFDRLVKKCRRPEYKNTFALRQQKMSC